MGSQFSEEFRIVIVGGGITGLAAASPRRSLEMQMRAA
jgi:monoamine oxidase